MMEVELGRGVAPVWERALRATAEAAAEEPTPDLATAEVAGASYS